MNQTMEMSDVYPILVVDTNSLTTSVLDAWTRFAVTNGPDWSPWGMHMTWGSWGIGMILMMVLFWAAIIVAIVFH